MPKRISELSERRLEYFLSRAREIAALGDEAAFIETDKLIYELEEAPYEDEDMDEAADREGQAGRLEREQQHFRERLIEFKSRIDSGERIGRFECSGLRREAQMLGIDWSPADRKKKAKELEKLRAQAVQLAVSAECVASRQAIDDTLTQPIHNTVSARDILQRLKWEASVLERHGVFTEELKQKVRSSKERVAWHRARKKLAAAEVAEAGGNATRAAKLECEAGVLLAQDWGVAFSGEAPPSA